MESDLLEWVFALGWFHELIKDITIDITIKYLNEKLYGYREKEINLRAKTA